jgi:hypothetical protein
MCKECENRGYVEEIYDDGEFIQSCGSCQLDLNLIARQLKAQTAALNDGYVLSESGRIVDFEY